MSPGGLGLSFGRVRLADEGPGPAAWERLERLPALAPGEVHLWLADLDAVPDGLEGWLSREEQAKAASLRAERDGRRSGAARALLRGLLGGYLGVPPGVVPLGRDAHGKPRLLGGVQPLEFNLSHSGGRALYAFGRGAPLGVDLEGPEAAPPEPHLLAAAYFHPTEVAALGRGAAATRRFLELWTRKEALGKARGDGLATATSPGPKVELDLPRQRLVARDGRAWLCVALDLPCPGAGALVVGC